MKRLLLVSALTFFSATASFNANASPELAKARNCLSCHTVDKTLVGPSYKDVAAKYAGNKDAETYLAKKIREGGTGVWYKDRVMPAMNQVTAAEASTLAKWILMQK